MSRRAPAGPPATEQGVVYTLHFDPPYPPYPPPGLEAERPQIAKHYTGFATDLDARLAEHAAGRGARLTQVQLAAGGSWRLASAEPGTRDREAQLKERGASRGCPICEAGRGLARQAEREPEAGQ
jgi:hypothetical protein